jgi:hypothetical protein
MFVSNMWSGSQHDSTKLPLLPAGGLGGTLETGRVLDVLRDQKADAVLRVPRVEQRHNRRMRERRRAARRKRPISFSLANAPDRCTLIATKRLSSTSFRFPIGQRKTESTLSHIRPSVLLLSWCNRCSTIS